MTDCICMVQAGQISAEQETNLRAGTDAFARAHFGSPAAINWVTVPEGNGYTEGKLSTSVIVSMTSDRSLSPSQREPLLRELGQIWERGAARGPDEVVTVIRDPAA
ncbi:MAG: hypothetical protein AAF697_12615 [Pseudomonadota bacterium]